MTCESLQDMRGCYVRHVEGRVLSHQDNVRILQIAHCGRTKREVIVPLITDFKRPCDRSNRTVSQRQVAGAVVEKPMTAFLRLQRERKRRVAGDIDALY